MTVHRIRTLDTLARNHVFGRRPTLSGAADPKTFIDEIRLARGPAYPLPPETYTKFLGKTSSSRPRPPLEYISLISRRRPRRLSCSRRTEDSFPYALTLNLSSDSVGISSLKPNCRIIAISSRPPPIIPLTLKIKHWHCTFVAPLH